jgi:hypothetical protein
MSDIKWTLAVAQLDCASGSIVANIAEIERFCRAATVRGVQLVVCRGGDDRVLPWRWVARAR